MNNIKCLKHRDWTTIIWGAWNDLV